MNEIVSSNHQQTITTKQKETKNLLFHAEWICAATDYALNPPSSMNAFIKIRQVNGHGSTNPVTPQQACLKLYEYLTRDEFLSTQEMQDFFDRLLASEVNEEFTMKVDSLTQFEGIDSLLLDPIAKPSGQKVMVMPIEIDTHMSRVGKAAAEILINHPIFSSILDKNGKKRFNFEENPTPKDLAKILIAFISILHSELSEKLFTNSAAIKTNASSLIGLAGVGVQKMMAPCREVFLDEISKHVPNELFQKSLLLASKVNHIKLYKLKDFCRDSKAEHFINYLFAAICSQVYLKFSSEHIDNFKSAYTLLKESELPFQNRDKVPLKPVIPEGSLTILYPFCEQSSRLWKLSEESCDSPLILELIDTKISADSQDGSKILEQTVLISLVREAARLFRSGPHGLSSALKEGDIFKNERNIPEYLEQVINLLQTSMNEIWLSFPQVFSNLAKLQGLYVLPNNDNISFSLPAEKKDFFEELLESDLKSNTWVCINSSSYTYQGAQRSEFTLSKAKSEEVIADIDKDESFIFNERFLRKNIRSILENRGCKMDDIIKVIESLDFTLDKNKGKGGHIAIADESFQCTLGKNLRDPSVKVDPAFVYAILAKLNIPLSSFLAALKSYYKIDK